MTEVWGGRVDTGQPDTALWGYVASSSVFTGAQFALGYFTAARRTWAIWTGVIAIPALAVYTTGMVFGFVETGGYFSARDPAMQLTLQTVAMTLLAVEFVAYLFALNAWYANRRPLPRAMPPVPSN